MTPKSKLAIARELRRVQKAKNGARKGGGVMYKGRRVSAHWYNRYVLGGVKPEPKTTRRPRKPKLAIHVTFFLPLLECSNDPAETRIVNLMQWTDIDWIGDMQNGYADLQTLRPTFFPNHP